MFKKYILIVIFICFIFSGVYVCSHLYIKSYGINVSPSKLHPPKSVKFNLQNDDRWKDDLMGNTKFNMGGHGCLVAVIATVFNDLGLSINAGVLNKEFHENGVYDENGEVIWFKINENYVQIKYRYSRIFYGKVFERDLEEGKLPIVMVKYYKTGVYHWVLIVGSDKDDFLIMDPLNKKKDFSKLSIHGNVYAYRILDKV